MRGRRNVDIHMDVELSIQLSEDRNALLNGRWDVGSDGDIERRVDHALIGFGHGAALRLRDAQAEVLGDGQGLLHIPIGHQSPNDEL